ncbi:MAG: sulfotransferase domain-containing protein, partial [Rubripirellula sp.]
MSTLTRWIAEKKEQFILNNLRLDGSGNGQLEKIGNWLPEDIFVVGYPKSGNTWFQNLVAGCMFGADPAITPDRLIQDMVPDVHYKHFVRRYQDNMVFKTHGLPAPGYRRVVMLTRDVRDVMVSYHRYLQTRAQAPLDFVNLVNTGEGLFPCQWHEHTTAWLENPYGADMIFIRYEDLLSDPLACLQRFCEFAGIEREDEELAWVGQRAQFSMLQKKEKKQGLENWRHDAPFFRRGVAGGYRDEMPAEVLDALMEKAGPAMESLGYITDSSQRD